MAADDAKPLIEAWNPTDDELAANAGRLADLISADFNQALAMGLSSGWDNGLTPERLAFMRARIAQQLHANLDAALQARGFVAAAPEPTVTDKSAVKKKS